MSLSWVNGSKAHVTYPKIVSHLTHDPWPTDPFPSLVRIYADECFETHRLHEGRGRVFAAADDIIISAVLRRSDHKRAPAGGGRKRTTGLSKMRSMHATCRVAELVMHGCFYILQAPTNRTNHKTRRIYRPTTWIHACNHYNCMHVILFKV